MATTNYSWNLPTVGGSEDTWGTQLNSNWTALDTLLGGVSATEFAILDGATVSTAELNILDGVTASTAELNILDGVTATTAEINYLSGVTSNIQTQLENTVPAGAVMTFAMNTAPSGWLKADGSAVSRATYAVLFTAIGTTFGAGDGSTTFNLPDMRGEFARGWDDGRGVDSGRAFGSAQGDAIRNITGFFSLSQLSNADQYGASQGGAIDIVSPTFSNRSGANSGTDGGQNDVSFDASRVVPTASENRPRNIALLYCIKT
jgi:microcystin-dependent protein